MEQFRFRLQRVLEWRASQLEMEESRVKHQVAALAALDRSREELAAEGARAGAEVYSALRLHGSDLAWLAAFRQFVKMKDAEIAVRRGECLRQLEERRAAMIEARRRVRLLERLKERRFEEWKSDRDRELEEVASDSYLAKWNAMPESASGSSEE